MIDTLTMAKSKALTLVLMFGLCLTLIAAVMPISVSAQSKEQVCLSLGQGYDAGANACTPGSGQPDSNARVTGIVSSALNLLSIVVGIAAVIMIILAGFRYITAGGDSSRISSAQNSIIWAVVGIIVVSTAQVIVRFVLGRL